MSRNDWERGELLLPSGEAVAVRRAVRDEYNRCVDGVYEVCKAFWRDERTRSLDKYEQALGRFVASRQRRFGRPQFANRRDWVSEHARWELQGILDAARAGAGTLRQVTRKDLAQHGLAPATSKTTTFQLESTSISFAGRKLSYWSGENNHQVERATSHPVVQALLRALEQVRWTRGSGGTFWGNDEYNRHEAISGWGSGASYLTRDYGPVGQAERARSMGLSVAQYRRRFAGR